MNNKNPEKPAFRGIIPPVVTPLLDEDTLDTEGFRKLIEHILEGGVHGLFILGTTGESTSLPYELRHELVKLTCTIVDGRVPVLVGITDTAPAESIRLAETAYKEGAAAVVAAPPYYYSLGQPELIEYYEFLLKRISLPLFLYNMPTHTKIIIEPETVETLSRHQEVAGLKDSSANSAYFNKVVHRMRNHPDFALFVGPEEIMAEAVLLGAHGGVNGGANMFPRLYVKLYEAAIKSDIAEMRRLHSLVMEISAGLYSLGNFGSSYLKGLKTSLSLMGICSGYLPSPLHEFESQEREKVAQNLKAIQAKLDI